MASSLNISCNIFSILVSQRPKAGRLISNIHFVGFQILLLLYRNFHRLTLNQIKILILICMNLH